MRKLPILIFSFLQLISCGKSSDDVISDIILDANIDLSRGDCQTAIDALEGIGRKNSNSQYLKTLASAYACRAGYSTTTFITTDLSVGTSVAPLGGLTKMSTSALTFQSPLENDPKFSDLQTAINILLYAGGIASTTEPTHSERAKYFSSTTLSDLETQLLYLQFVELGIYMTYYGNAKTSTGAKGAGSGTNVCFSDYPNLPANSAAAPIHQVRTALSALPGSCHVMTDVGHPEIRSSVTAATRKTRMCRGIILYNGFFTSITNLSSIFSGSAGTSISSILTAAVSPSTAMTAVYSDIGSVKSTLNQTTCEDNSVVPVAELESYFAIIFEGSIK